MFLTAKAKGELHLALSLCDGLEDNNIQQIKILLEHNAADPNVMIPSRGVTPFHLIVGNECEKFARDVTKLFLRHGGNPNVKSVEGMTPVHVAAAWGRVKILEILLANGGDSLALDEDGHSPFDHAFAGSYYEALAILGRYSTKKDDEDEDENEVKVEIKLEKILINHGDIVAEYVTSESDTETVKANNISVAATTNERSDHSYVITRQTGELSSLNTDNVTLRRYQRLRINSTNSISPKLPDVQCNQTSNRQIPQEECDKKIQQLNSYTPQTRIIKNNTTVRNSPRFPLDNSIVSTSPNFVLTPKKRMNHLSKLTDPMKIKDNRISTTPKKKANHTSSRKKMNFSNYNSIPKKIMNKTETGVMTSPHKSLENSDEDLKNINCEEHEKNEKNNWQINNEFKNDITVKKGIEVNLFKNQVEFDVNKMKKCYTSSGVSLIKCDTTKGGKIPLDGESPILDELDKKCMKKERISLTSTSTCSNSSTMSSELSFIAPKALSDTLSSNDVYKTPLKNNLKAIESLEKSELLPSSDTETYKTPAISVGNSKSSNESFYSVDEEYAYIDSGKDVAFLERRLRFIPKNHDMDKAHVDFSLTDEFSELSLDSEQITEPSSDGFEKAKSQGDLALTNVSLRQHLLALGYIPGPITDTTYPVYLKRLYKLRKAKPENLNDCVLESESQCEAIRHLKIPANMLSTEWTQDLQPYRDLEEAGFKEYENPSATKKYRGGVAKTSFNYLLLDPRITKDLPRTGRGLSLDERWKIFLEAIFYVGKGKAARPLAHLYDAFDYWTGKNRNDVQSDKTQRILDIWREGKGVVCLQVFTNTMQEEAFTREAAMIDALGTDHLSNCNRGNYYGIVATMSTKEKRFLGKYILYKAMEIFMQEGERQQFPKNIE